VYGSSSNGWKNSLALISYHLLALHLIERTVAASEYQKYQNVRSVMLAARPSSNTAEMIEI
jgi:hypothetical protein